jgi:hypothetical protein
MQKLNLFFSIFLIVVYSCGDNESKNNVASQEDYYQFQLLDLHDYDIPISLYLPDASSGIGTAFKPEVIHAEGDYKWVIQVGRYFKLFIEDFGDFRYLMDEKMKSLENSTIYKIEFLKKSPQHIIYSREILSKQDWKNPRKTYHLYGVFQIDGVYYQLMNREDGNTEKEIDFMEKSFLSIKTKNL